MQSIASEEVINNLLNDVLKEEDIPIITNIKIEKGSKKGDNFVGVIKKAIIEGTKENGKPVTLTYFIKQAPTDAKWRQIFQCEKCFTRETFMYEKVLPTFAQLETDHNISEKLKYPQIYAISKEQGSETIIMEDLTSKKFEVKDRRQPLNLQHCKLVMGYFAQLHSRSFILKKENPGLFDELSYLPETFFTGEVLDMIKSKKLEGTLTRNLASLDGHENREEIAKRLTTFYDELVDHFEFCAYGNNSNGYNVICHGDCWINNFLFKYEDEDDKSDPSEVCFIDWQLSRHASPLTDLFYFIYTSTDRDMRDQHLDELFEEYYSRLADSLFQFGEDVETHFPKSEFQRHIKIFSKFGLIIAMCILQATMGDPNQAIDPIEIANDPIGSSQKSHDIATHDDLFKERTRGIITEMYDKEYI